MRAIFLILLGSLLLTSCGGKAGKTEATLTLFQSKIAGLGSDADGSLMLWGKGPATEWGKTVDPNGGEIVLELTNGSWTFWAVAWDGGSNMQGIPRCAIANTSFDGGAANVDLTLSNANCEMADFSLQPLNGVADSKTFPQIKVASCNQGSGITDETHHASECAFTTGKKGYVLSYEIVYPDFENGALGANELVSDCQVV